MGLNQNKSIEDIVRNNMFPRKWLSPRLPLNLQWGGCMQPIGEITRRLFLRILDSKYDLQLLMNTKYT